MIDVEVDVDKDVDMSYRQYHGRARLRVDLGPYLGTIHFWDLVELQCGINLLLAYQRY